jgi:hypothetical protein
MHATIPLAARVAAPGAVLSSGDPPGPAASVPGPGAVIAA